ncbi:MAG TPA: orotidine-5'-phosphate decarboxylase [Candidatus Contendobacter sp.]|nr:orotidine-5'-phosphate decarboxylase [Candidatus Contendobacter sp.]HRD48583.1 orotidine-5'-phosphate decarboxylase [Candidatus Contendobacter sp.]
MAKNIPINERIIFALDVDSKDEAERWLDRLGDRVNFYKVGLQLFLAGGFPVIEMILARNHKAMVDLKFFDIPETVGLAVRELKSRGATFITVHGNDPILRAAVQERNGSKILAVTVLTSFDESDMRAMGLTQSIEELVYHRAKKAIDLGCDGVISSALEVSRVRDGLGDKFLIVTPGIRPGTNDVIKDDDQKRIASANLAIKNGADYVVVGRPIRNAKDPVAVVKAMQEEITAAL